MARIYLGNQEPSDRGMLEALRRLPDEFHVFVEFTVNYAGKQRQADFMVVREEVRPCSLFMLEVKNERRRLRGTVNGAWEVQDEDGPWRELPVSNLRDQNPLQQAQNTARLLRDWIISMQSLIQDEDDPWQNPAYNMTAFPRLVLPFAHAQNALQKDNFAWVFTSYDETVSSLLRFRGTRDFPLSRREIERLAEHLGLQPTYVEPVATLPAAEPEPDELSQLRGEVAALRGDMAEVLRLLREGAALGRATATLGGGMGLAPIAGAPPAPEKMEELCEAVVAAVRTLRDTSQKRFFPNVHGLLRQRFGGFQPQVYGFVSFKAFMQEVERRGLIQLTTINSADWALLPGEDVNEAVQVLAEPPAQFVSLELALQQAFVEFIATRGSLQPHMTANWLGLQLVQNGILPMGTAQVRGLVMQGIKEGVLLEGIHETVHRETGQPFFLRTVRLNRAHPLVERILAMATSDAPHNGASLREQDPALT